MVLKNLMELNLFWITNSLFLIVLLIRITQRRLCQFLWGKSFGKEESFIMSLICKSQSISFHSFHITMYINKNTLYSNCIKLLICSHCYHIVDLFKCQLLIHMKRVCETKFCGIIDQSLFYIDLTVHYIQNFENLTQTSLILHRHCLYKYRSTSNFAYCNNYASYIILSHSLVLISIFFLYCNIEFGILFIS